MSRKIFFFLALLIFSLSANAQFHFGPKAGLNATKIDGKSFKDQFEYNYLVGGFVEISLGNRFSIAPEVLFSQTSTTLADGADPSVFNIDQAQAKLNYLSIPILANIKIAGPLNIEIGPQYSALISSNEDLLKNGERAFKNGDFSMLGGVKIKFAKFRLTGRYAIGLDNISHLPSNEKWKSQSFQLALGFAIL